MKHCCLAHLLTVVSYFNEQTKMLHGIRLTNGGTKKLRRLEVIAQQRKWIVKTLYLFFTLLVLQENPKDWYTAVEGIWFIRPTHLKMYFNILTMMFIGVRQILVGLLVILILFMDR